PGAAADQVEPRRALHVYRQPSADRMPARPGPAGPGARRPQGPLSGLAAGRQPRQWRGVAGVPSDRHAPGKQRQPHVQAPGAVPLPVARAVRRRKLRPLPLRQRACHPPRFRADAGARQPGDPGSCMNNPYRHLPDHQFWRRSVSALEPFRLDPVVRPRFRIARDDRVATAGSCFAQHISRRLAGIGFNYQVVEAGEALPEAERIRRNFGVFSARYGNIYTSRQLLQLFQSCFEDRMPVEAAWLREDGRHVDALRPAIEPDGHGSVEEVLQARTEHLGKVRALLESCDVFVFTLGLTEAWLSRRDGTAYPLA